MKVTVVSNFAEDVYIDSNGKYIKTEEGGPARFLSSVLKLIGVDFTVVSGKGKGKVIIQLKKGNEIGKLEFAPPINLQDNTYDLVIIELSDDYTTSQ